MNEREALLYELSKVKDFTHTGQYFATLGRILELRDPDLLAAALSIAHSKGQESAYSTIERTAQSAARRARGLPTSSYALVLRVGELHASQPDPATGSS
jgi:hypothetical protein